MNFKFITIDQTISDLKKKNMTKSVHDHHLTHLDLTILKEFSFIISKLPLRCQGSVLWHGWKIFSIG